MKKGKEFPQPPSKVRNWGNRKINLPVKSAKAFWNSAKHYVPGVQFLRALLFKRKHSRSQTRKITHRLLDLLGKILKEIRKIERDYENAEIEWTGHRFAHIENIKR